MERYRCGQLNLFPTWELLAYDWRGVPSEWQIVTARCRAARLARETEQDGNQEEKTSPKEASSGSANQQWKARPYVPCDLRKWLSPRVLTRGDTGLPYSDHIYVEGPLNGWETVDD